MRFFNSKNVKIFPCSNRGIYSSTEAGTLDSVFDLESRLASEYNFTNLPGIIDKLNNKKSYVISLEQLPCPITPITCSKDSTGKHQFNEKGVCSCGGISDKHTHQFNANNICLNCGWEPDYLLKVVINGYYFEIITKKFLIFTVNNGTDESNGKNLTNDYKSILDSKLWVTLQKTRLREADLHDNARHTYQLGSMFARSYTGTYEAEKAADEQNVTNSNSSNYYLSQQPTTSASTIANSSIALDILDFPANTDVAGGPEKEYYCAAIGITSNGNSLEPCVVDDKDGKYFEVLLETESGETEADVVLCCLDLSDPANWLENLAAGEFLYSPDFENRVDGPDNLAVNNIYVSNIAPTQTKSGTITENGTLNIEATSITAGAITANTVTTTTHNTNNLTVGTAEITTKLSACPTANITDLTVSTVSLPAMSKITLTEEPEESNSITLLAKVNSMIDEAEKSVTKDLRGDLVLRKADTENEVSEIKLDSDINITKLYGNTPCIADESKSNENSTDTVAWDPDIPKGLTLTGLRQEISRLTQKGGEPNKLNYLYIGDTKLSTTSKGDDTLVVDLDQTLAIANLSDASRVSDLETLVGTSEFYADTDTTIVKDIADLKVQLKNLDNVMNFVDVITPTEFENYTKSTTYTDRDDRTIEVGDVVVVTLDGGFNYLGNRYTDGTEFICTEVLDKAETVKWQKGEETESLARLSIWQEIGTCNITDSTLKELIGEDTDSTRKGSVKERLCSIEDQIGNDDDTDPSIKAPIKARIKKIETSLGELPEDSTVEDRLAGLESTIGDYSEDNDSIGDRLSSLEALTSTTGDIVSAIATNTGAIGDASSEGTIIYRLNGIETTLVTGATPGSSVLDRLAAVENTLGGTGGGADGDDNEGETTGSLPDRVTTVEGKVTDIQTAIGDDNTATTIKYRIKTLEDNAIVTAAKDLTLDQFRTNIKDSVIADKDFISKVDTSISNTVAGQTPGKVVVFIDNFASTEDFKNTVKSKVESYAQSNDFTSKVDSQIAPYLETDDFKGKINEELTSYELTPADITVVESKASQKAQDYTLTDDDIDIIENKASETAQNYDLSATDVEVIEAKASEVAQNYTVDTSKVTNALDQAVSDYEVDTSKATQTLDDTVTNYEVNTSRITQVLDQAVNDYEVDTSKIENTVDTAIQTMLQNLTFVALAFDLNGISGFPVPPIVALSGSSIELPIPTSIPAGKEFKGWATTTDATQGEFTLYTPSQNTIYYASWMDSES